MRLRDLLLALAAAALPLEGCAPPTGLSHAFVKAQKDKIVGAATVSYAATRVYADYGGTEPRSYVEWFARAPDGRFVVKLLQLDGKSRDELMDPAAIEAFDQLAKRFEGGLGGFIAASRDFRIRNVELAGQNYVVVPLDNDATVAGRPAYLLDVWPRDLDRPKYTVWVDRDTFITLRYQEFAPTGALAAEMKVQALDLAPDLSDVEFPAPIFTKKILIEEAQIKAFAPFTTFVPTYRPPGFVLDEVSVSTIMNVPVIVRTYSDGIQEIFIAQHPEILQLQAPDWAPSTADVPVRVSVTLYGAAAFSLFALDGTEVQVLAKLHPVAMIDLVEGLDRF